MKIGWSKTFSCVSLPARTAFGRAGWSTRHARCRRRFRRRRGPPRAVPVHLPRPGPATRSDLGPPDRAGNGGKPREGGRAPAIGSGAGRTCAGASGAGGRIIIIGINLTGGGGVDGGGGRERERERGSGDAEHEGVRSVVARSDPIVAAGLRHIFLLAAAVARIEGWSCTSTSEFQDFAGNST